MNIWVTILIIILVFLLLLCVASIAGTTIVEVERVRAESIEKRDRINLTAVTYNKEGNIDSYDGTPITIKQEEPSCFTCTNFAEIEICDKCNRSGGSQDNYHRKGI